MASGKEEQLPDGIIIDAPPSIVYIEPTNRCNLSCRICFRTHWDKAQNPPQDMSIETFAGLEPLLESSPTVDFVGAGEPLMAKNIWSFFETCSRHRCHVLVHTNYSMLDEHTTLSLLESGVSKLIVSVTGYLLGQTKDWLAPELQSIYQAIDRLNRYRSAAGLIEPQAQLHFTPTIESLSSLPEILHSALDLGIKKVELNHIYAYTPELKDASLFCDIEYSKSKLQEAMNLSQKLGIELRIPSFGDDAGWCNEPFESMLIKSNGDVLACSSACFKPYKYTCYLGNLSEQSLEELWNGKAMQAIRGGLMGRQELHGACRVCGRRIHNLESHLRY